MSLVLYVLRSFLRDAAIGAWTASYDPVGNLTCRAAPGSGTTCAGSSPTGALLGYDNEERLYGWQNAPTNSTQSTAYLYDGAGRRVEQVVMSGGATEAQGVSRIWGA